MAATRSPSGRPENERDDTEAWVAIADKMTAENQIVQTTSKTLVEESLSSLRKLADTLNEEKWLYEHGQPSRRVECSL